ncbi:unnamed protein product [Clavelina lepadiformis]|uniref:Uncharacterized protein n=1 Tax=Clavelina lepadiformis TaxID=159417 RepID=A0ABP0GUQ6_CLALP
MVKIFVGRLAPTVSSAQLRDLFEKYGPVSDCDILRDYGFVHMSHESDAQRAISALDKYDLCGSRLSVELSTSRSMKSCQLTVKNLPGGITSQDLHKLFKKFGTVTLCRINSDSATVHMRFPSMATNAVRNLSGETYRGNVLSVQFANTSINKPVAAVLPKPAVKSNGSIDLSNTNGISNPEQRKPIITMASKPKQPAWKQPEVILDKNTSTGSLTPATSAVPSTKQGKPSELREGRQVRIKQGLKFLQSPMPWSGTREHYETFLNQLKEMLLEEGPELFREGHIKEAISQLSEAINICNYMKTEGIKGHMENLDKLLMERATMHLNSGNSVAAVDDSDKAISISNGQNQNALRFKARMLVECGKRNEALCFLLKFQQTQTLDAESTQLCNILKQSLGVRDDASLPTNTKGAIGDGRSRPSPAQSFQSTEVVNSNAFGVHKSSWPVINGSGDNKNSFAPSYSNFGDVSSLLGPAIQALHSNTDPFPQRGSHFQQFFNQPKKPNVSSSFNSFSPGLGLDTQIPGTIMPPNTSALFPSSNFQPPSCSSSSLFSSDLYSPQEQNTNGVARDVSRPLPIGFQRQQNSTSSPWNESTSLGLSSVGSESSVDNKIDEELARAIEEELGTNNNISSFSPGIPWSANLEQVNSSLSFRGNENTSSYSHFPIGSSKIGFTGSVLGPAMLGIHTTAQTVKPAPPSPIDTNPEPTPPYVEAPDQAEMNDSLSEILRNPLHDTHEFKLGCTECVLRTGSRVVDFKHDEAVQHLCYKNILLCRRRGNVDWVKIRPRPQPQSKAQLYDGPYYICKDLMSGQDCTYPAVCTFAYNQEEIDVWTLERKGMLNRAWLCKSMDMNFVKNLSLVGLILCKHRGIFDFLCKMCFQNKPRIISKFSPTLGKCTNENTPHRNILDHQQLTHILREGTVKYTEIRSPTQQAILCRHAIRFQCSRGEECHFAHSLVERDIWAIMNKENLSAADIVKQSLEHMNKQVSANQDSDSVALFSTDGSLSEFRWKAKFICSLCHKNGQINEATKDMKYCTARAQHSWTTNKKVMLVFTARKAWAQVRDLPYLKNKNLPARFELCENYRRNKKCTFSGKCNFAHSQEEMDIWMYLRENTLKDLEELYDALTKDKQAKSSSRNSTQGPDASNILLPTDILLQSAFHCWLCDKECNGQRQWEKHCLSEKHKLRAISDSDGHWRFRKPGGNYKICERHGKGICEYDLLPASENACPNAHSKDELEEWVNRRQYVINRIKKAQDDQLIDSIENMDDLINCSPQA